MTTPANKKSISELKANDTSATAATATAMDVDQQQEDDADIDPLDAYMLDVTAEARKINEEDQKRMQDMEYTETNKRNVMNGEEDDDQQKGSDDEYGSDPEDILAMAAKKVKRKDLAAVDHSKMNYETFRKDFYIEPAELRDMTNDQVDLLRVELDGIKIRGVDCPKPIQKWTHCGLPVGCLEIIRKLKFDKPTSIQAQAIPAIMHGRDVIGVAKTGSGKTIAFLLPMFRHIKDQRPLEMGEGPMAIIMTPTRELATQIHRECKPFLKVLGLRAVCAYGGSPIKDQIADLKRGAEIIVCTPGRMIDLLCANSGRVTNLARVTYMVLDEADRMFDMGFEPQVMKIVNNVRPNRQTVLFSATFPRQMEALARKVLKKPLEITVGGRSVVCSDVEQIVEVREDATKFMRLLEILGQFYNDEDDDARVLIFVDRQEAADNLLRDLIRKGYVCQSLHGGKDQVDRDSTIADFKSGATNILIATSVAARGLDVKQLKLVVNYECPNHMEDYVHRVGRTGRAGNKGTAYTFITPTQERYAMDICKALKLVVKSGQERFAGSGFGGKGLERFDKDRDMVKKIQKKAYGGDDLEESDEEVELESTRIIPGQPRAATMESETNGATTAAAAGSSTSDQGSSVVAQAARKAAEVAARLMANAGMNSSQTMETTDDSEDARPVFAEEININDFPQKARWKVTNREQISQISEITGAAITTRGTFFPTGKQPGPNERKLYLFIEGDSEMVLENAKREIKRILEEATVASLEAEARTGGGAPARYSVV
ncbi:P-loop containing nucleoside triphosphate hydrolase protein [Absidia repens]|uniref:RNA helicase n=1 Tax=Absidia repens TaxID=90262 RepID=A0A1X2I2A5_9FUNG|nr:P-loop containing nucleoside triphosphate hydrolase protein [Absidia repens]